MAETDRATERLLRQTEERFRCAFENAPTGISITDRDGRLEQCNAAYARILGRAVDELVGQRFADFVHPADCAASHILWERLASGEVPSFDVETRCLRSDGSEVWVYVRSALVRDADDRPEYIVTVVEDMTDRRATRWEPPIGSGFRHSMTAEASLLPALRRALRAWAADAGVPPACASDLLLAVDEACANAIEHAYLHRAPGPVHVSVAVDGTMVTATVRDEGDWRIPDGHATAGGRGTSVINAMCASYERTTDSTGTRVVMRLRSV